MRKPVVSTYHCDLELPPGIVCAVTTPIIRASHYLTGKLSHRIVVNTHEFGEEARLPRRFRQKVVTVYPPIELAEGADPAELRARWGLEGGPLVGFVGRFSEEKGIDDLIDAVPHVLREFPNARVVLAGPTAAVPGERVHERLQPKIQALGDRWVHLGLVSDDELAALYRIIDVLVLPSTNSTESFGMAQVEAMLAGTPVVATDIPGVREAVRLTGMGRLVPPRDALALARAISTVLGDPDAYVCPEGEISARFDPEVTVDFYEQLFAELTGQPLRAGAAPVASKAGAPSPARPLRTGIRNTPASSRRR